MTNKRNSIYIEKKSKNNQLKELGYLKEEAVLKKLETNTSGLSNQEAEKRLERYGLNEVAVQKPMPWYLLLLQAFKDPFIYVLTLLLVVSAATKDFEASIVMAMMILFSAGLHFIQEFR
ncbi:MAG: cation-transporting P-type ATPase, partial [Carnobacterium inhibens]